MHFFHDYISPLRILKNREREFLIFPFCDLDASCVLGWGIHQLRGTEILEASLLIKHVVWLGGLVYLCSLYVCMYLSIYLYHLSTIDS